MVHVGIKEFLDKEGALSTKFGCKPKSTLVEGARIKFNGGSIFLNDGIVKLHQLEQMEKIERIAEKDFDLSSFVSQHARSAYIASASHLDVTSAFAVCYLVVYGDTDAVKLFSKFVEISKKNRKLCLSFVQVETVFLRLSFFVNTSVASNADMPS